MVQVIKLRRSPIPGHIPTATSIQLGELAINTSDGKLFLAKTGITENEIVEVLTTNTYNTGNLNLGGNMVLTGGTYSGDGSDLYNIPYSGLSGSFSKTINGTTFDGTANIITSFWGTGRTITIGSTGKSVNGSADVSWSLSEIGAFATPTGLTTNYLTKTSGSTLVNSLLYDDGTNIGLGTTSLFSNSKLTISAASGLSIIGIERSNPIATGGIGAIAFKNTDPTTPFISAITSTFGTTTDTAYLSFRIGTPSASPFSLTELMRLSDSGSLGLGTTTLTGINFRNSKTITGSVSSYANYSDGVIQSDVTSNAYYYRTLASTLATGFTLTNLYHYIADQTTIGAGSTVTNQYGFYVSSLLVGATNNYGFFSNIASGSNRWNLYMGGTASNYLAGSLGIGTTTLTGINFRNSKTITGAVTSYGNLVDGTIQSDVTTSAYYNRTFSNTQATTFTLSVLHHYAATQNVIGAGSTVTSQIGFNAESSLVGATNNYGFYGNIPSGSNRWNIYMNGTANNYIAGNLGIGSTSLTGISLRIGKTLTGSVSSSAIQVDGTIQSDVTTGAYHFNSIVSTQATGFTLPFMIHYNASQSTIGAGSTLTAQYGFYAGAPMIGATNNYAFFGNIPSGSNRWNIYMNGTADNYLGGSLGIGTATLTGINLNIAKTITGAVSSYAVYQNGTVQSDVTSDAFGFRNHFSTQAASFTLSLYYHYAATQGTIGAGSTVTSQNGFLVNASLIGATNNYGFRGIIPSGSNRWNIYMDGTADNYLAGALGIGSTSLTGFNVRVSKTINGNSGVGYGVLNDGVVQSDVNSQGYGITNNFSTQATAFTIPDYYHFFSRQVTIGAGSTVTNQYGFTVSATLVGATNNYGFYGNIPSGSNRWNIYMNGTANNYIAGNLGIGATSLTQYTLRISKNVEGSTISYAQRNDGVIQSGVTSYGILYASVAATQATTFTLNNLSHFYAGQGTFGAGSTVTNQVGFWVESSLTGATNNYGFRSDIASGSNRWNLYMNGTADNYIKGNLGIDVENPTYKFQVTTGSGGAYFTRTSGDTGAIAPALGLVTASTTTRIYSFGDALQFFLAATGGTANNIMELKSNGTLYIGTSSADTSALLHVSSTTKGVLFPQMTTTQINAISSPANGLLVYNTTLNKLCVYESGSWKQMTTTTM